MATAAASMANVTFVDCNGGFMARGKINSKLMPDALHPNPAGADAEAYCPKTLLTLPRERSGGSVCWRLLIVCCFCVAGLDVLAKCHKGVLSDLGLLKQTRRLHVRLKQ